MTIKTGDLVMVVRPAPCCGNVKAVGRIFTAQRINTDASVCIHCGHPAAVPSAVVDGKAVIYVSRLKKIDPPADGDSLPTRKDVEVVA